MHKKSVRTRAIRLRSEGYSLDEIASSLTVSRSTVYYWISSLKLNDDAKRLLGAKKQAGRLMGGNKKRQSKIEKIRKIQKKSKKQIGTLTKRDLFLVGLALYWGEGTKISERSPTQRTVLSNSDPRLIKIFLKWLDSLGVDAEYRIFTLYIHKKYKSDEKVIKQKWSHFLEKKITNWEKTVFKKNLSNRQKDINYIGTLRVTVKKSTDLNRKIASLIDSLASTEINLKV